MAVTDESNMLVHTLVHCVVILWPKLTLCTLYIQLAILTRTRVITLRLIDVCTSKQTVTKLLPGYNFSRLVLTPRQNVGCTHARNSCKLSKHTHCFFGSHFNKVTVLRGPITCACVWTLGGGGYDGCAIRCHFKVSLVFCGWKIYTDYMYK